MANGEVLDRIVESHYSPAALLYLSHKHFEDSTQKPEPSQLQMPALLGQIRGIGGIKERIKVKKKVPGLLNVYSQDPRHEYHYQILDYFIHYSVLQFRGGEREGGRFHLGPLRANELGQAAAESWRPLLRENKHRPLARHIQPGPDTCVPFTKHIRALNTPQRG